MVLCPYCGTAQAAPASQCKSCGGFFDALSRKVSQQHMGPWYIRDANNPFRPGCSYETLLKMISVNKLQPDTIMRGPTTRQYWTVAWRVPGVSHLIGFCYACQKKVTPNAEFCPHCRVRFPKPDDRDAMGLDPDDPTVMQQVQQARAAEAAARQGQPAGQPVMFKPAQATAPVTPPTRNQPPAPPAAPTPQKAQPAASPARIIRTIPTTDPPSQPSSTPPAAAPKPVQPAASTPAGQNKPPQNPAVQWEAPATVDFEPVGSSLPAAGGRKNSMQLVVGLVCINLLLILAVVIVVMIRNRDNLDSLNDNSNVKPSPRTQPDS